MLQGLERAGEVKKLIRVVEAWDREGTISLDAGLAQARAFLELRLMDRAWVRLRELDQAHPDQPDIIALTARVFVERGWPARARKVAERLRQLAPEHPALPTLDQQVGAPPQGPPSHAKEIERQGDPAALLALAESYLATGSFLRAKSILERVRRARPLDRRVDLLLWGLQGDFLGRGTTLAELVEGVQLAGEWEGVENTESVRHPDLSAPADPPTAEVTRSMLVAAGIAEPSEDRFPSLFRRVSPGGPDRGLPGSSGFEEEDDITVSVGLASSEQLRQAPAEEHTDPGVAGDSQDPGGDTQIMQVIPGPGGARLGEVDGPIHRDSPGSPDGLRETLDLRAWQESMGMAGAGVEELADQEDEDFLEAEDEDLVVMTRREDGPAEDPVGRGRSGPIEVIEKHPQPPPGTPAAAMTGPEDLPTRLDSEPESEEVAGPAARRRSTTRLVLTVALMALVMGGATALTLRYLHQVVATSQLDEAERTLAAGDYRGLLELEARLDNEVGAEITPRGARALALAMVEAVLWGEYTGNPDQRARALEALELARALGVDASRLALAEGMLALQDRQIQRAAALSGQAGTETEAARFLAARVALEQGDPARGLELWGQGGSGVRHQLLGEALLRASGDDAAASRLADSMLQAAGDNPLVAVAALSRNWSQQQALERIGSIDALLDSRRDELSPRQVGALHAEKARLLQGQDKTALAVDAWRKAVSVDPTRAEALVALAAADLADNQVELALAGLEDCVRFNPAVLGCRRGTVQALLELDRIQEAQASLADWQGPSQAIAPLQSWIAVQDERGADAKAELVAQVEAAEGLGEGVALYALGLALAAEPDGARNADRSLELAVQTLQASSDPFDGLLLQRARAARVEVVDSSQVEALVREVLADGGGDPMVHVHVGRRYERLGRRSAAAQHLEKATRLGPQSALAWYELGQFWFAPSTMDQAMAAWRSYLALEPSGARAERTRGRLQQ